MEIDIKQRLRDGKELQLDLAQARIQVIDDALKIKILHWLMHDVRLLRPMGDDQLEQLKENLPQYCRTGVMFADLINRVAGREDVIKGIQRNLQGNSKSLS